MSHTELGIYGFAEPFAFLSNFYPCTVTFEGETYSTVEHAYQAAKTLDPAQRAHIQKLATPGQAKRAGRDVTLRSDWDQIRVAVMRNLLEQKFAPGSVCAHKLCLTEDHLIEETNTWGDTFWGVCRGEGLNVLGELLMEIRADLLSHIEFKNWS